jgi:hypothetical protein
MNCVKDEKKNYKNKFIEIKDIINNIDLFERYSLKQEINNNNNKNQLFSKIPSFDFVSKILYTLINKELNDNIYFEFSRNNLVCKNIIEKINSFIPQLKEYYLKCKHKKYLEKLNDKKIITIFRQLLRNYDYSINAVEKYNNGKKYLLYIIEKKKNLDNGIISFKKINSLISFD